MVKRCKYTIAQRRVNNKLSKCILNALAFLFLFIFLRAPYWGCDFYKKVLMVLTKYYQIRDERVWLSINRHPTCPIEETNWRLFWVFFLNAVRHIGGSYRSILLIFNSKHVMTISYLVFKLKENQIIIVTVRVAEWTSTKWRLWRHRFRNFKAREKSHWQISARSFVEISSKSVHSFEL